MRATPNDLPMPPLFRRLLLLFYALRYGARLVWLAAPAHHKLHWAVSLLQRIHEADAHTGLQRALPQLGLLAGAFVDALERRPELATGTMHDALDALEHLTEPLPPAQTEHALSAALGRPLATVFASIDLVPVSSGFAEQIHLGQLIEPAGAPRRVAIKLLRRTQLQQIGDEAALLRGVARWLEKLSGAARRLQVRARAESFTDDLLRRFDLRAQAANQSQVAHHFDDDTRVVIPSVIWELTTDTTLVTQHFESLAVTDLVGLSAHHVRLAPLAAHIVEIATQQAFEHGFFNAALDARHVRVSIEPDTLGRLVLERFAVMSNLSTQEREFFVHGATALFEQDYGRLAALHADAGHLPQTTRTERLEAELRTRAEAHFAGASHERSAGALFHHLLHSVQPFGGDVPARLVAAQRSFAQAEALANTLHPALDTWHIARTVLANLARRDADHRGWIKHLAQELPHLAHLMPRVPQLAVRYLQHRHAEHSPQQQAQLLRELAREYRRTRRLLWACAVCGCLLGIGYVVLAS
jgi:ubiquinone biosynthesis protein